MTLQPGTPAPLFQAADLFGRTVDLAAYRGKPVLLSLLRNAACALCNLRVHQLILRYPAYQRAGLELIAVFESSREAMLQHVGKQDVPFPLIADPEGELYALYRAESSEAKVAKTMAMPATQQRIVEAAAQGFQLTPEPGSNFLRMPADFFISADGLLTNVHYAEYVWDHMPFAVIDELLAAPVPAR